MSNKVDATLQQQGQLGQYREFQIISGKELRVILGTPKKQRTYMVHLLALADKSRIGFHIAWRWFYVLVASLCGMLIYSVVDSFVEISPDYIGFIVIAIFSLSALLALVMIGLNFSRKRTFYSRHSRVPLFDIIIGRPNQRAYKTFLDSLNGFIASTRTFWNLKLDQQIAGEVRMLRRLAKEGVISQRQYDRAKARLFDITSNKSQSS